MTNRPSLVKFGDQACGTTFSGGIIKFQSKTNDGSLSLLPLDFITFKEVWRKISESGEIVRQQPVEITGLGTILLKPFKLFDVPGNYFLNVYAETEAGDSFEIYRSQINLHSKS